MNGKRLKVANDLLIDVWSSGMLDKLLDPDSPSEGSGLQIAKIGYPVWSDEIFSDSKPPLNNSSSSSSSSVGAEKVGQATVMTAAYCGESVPTGLAITTPASSSITGESCDDHCDPASWTSTNTNNQKSGMYGMDEFAILDGGSKRKRRSTQESRRMTAQELAAELSSSSINPHVLVSPHAYGEYNGAGQNKVQPFTVKVHPQVGMLADVHSHLCEAEVIGLLAGKYDAENKIIYIQFPFPCVSTVREEDNGSTDVELDPVAEIAVRETIAGLGLQVVGWYHSHPKFRPDPSVIDIHNQAQNQEVILNMDEYKAAVAAAEAKRMEKGSRGGSQGDGEDGGADISNSHGDRNRGKQSSRAGVKDADGTNIDQAPFVGLIVSPWDQTSPSISATHQWFHVTDFNTGVNRRSVRIPLLLDVIYRYSKHTPGSGSPNTSEGGSAPNRHRDDAIAREVLMARLAEICPPPANLNLAAAPATAAVPSVAAVTVAATAESQNGIGAKMEIIESAAAVNPSSSASSSASPGAIARKTAKGLPAAKKRRTKAEKKDAPTPASSSASASASASRRKAGSPDSLQTSLPPPPPAASEEAAKRAMQAEGAPAVVHAAAEVESVAQAETQPPAPAPASAEEDEEYPFPSTLPPPYNTGMGFRFAGAGGTDSLEDRASNREQEQGQGLMAGTSSREGVPVVSVAGMAIEMGSGNTTTSNTTTSSASTSTSTSTSNGGGGGSTRVAPHPSPTPYEAPPSPPRRISSRESVPVAKFQAYGMPDKKLLLLKGSLPNSSLTASEYNVGGLGADADADAGAGAGAQARGGRGKPRKSQPSCWPSSPSPSADPAHKARGGAKAKPGPEAKAEPKATAGAGAGAGAGAEDKDRDEEHDTRLAKSSSAKGGNGRFAGRKRSAGGSRVEDKGGSSDVPERGSRASVTTRGGAGAAKAKKTTATYVESPVAAAAVAVEVAKKAIGTPRGTGKGTGAAQSRRAVSKKGQMASAAAVAKTTAASRTGTGTGAGAGAGAGATSSGGGGNKKGKGIDGATRVNAPSANSSSNKRKPAPKPLSLAGALQTGSRESELATSFLVDLPPALRYLRGVVLVLVSMGLYYGQHQRRVNLAAKSRFQISKNDKMVQSACAWVEGLGLMGDDRGYFRERVTSFFLACYS